MAIVMCLSNAIVSLDGKACCVTSLFVVQVVFMETVLHPENATVIQDGQDLTVTSVSNYPVAQNMAIVPNPWNASAFMATWATFATNPSAVRAVMRPLDSATVPENVGAKLAGQAPIVRLVWHIQDVRMDSVNNHGNAYVQGTMWESYATGCQLIPQPPLPKRPP